MNKSGDKIFNIQRNKIPCTVYWSEVLNLNVAQELVVRDPKPSVSEVVLQVLVQQQFSCLTLHCEQTSLIIKIFHEFN